jgi:hypothetical protein
LVLGATGATLSQFPPEVVVAVGVNICAELSLAVTMTFCAAGAVPPAVAVKLRGPAGLTLSVIGGGVVAAGVMV